MVPQEGGVDYLKIKVLLYKFTPEMKIATGHRVSQQEPVFRKSAAAQSLVNQTADLKKKLQGWQSTLSQFTLTTTTPYNTVKSVVESVNGLVSLDTIKQNNLLLLQDSTQSPKASAELAGTSSAPSQIPIRFETPRPPAKEGDPRIGLGSDTTLLGAREGTELAFMTLLQQCEYLVTTLSYKSGNDFSPEPTFRQTIRKINIIVSNITGFLAEAIQKCSNKIFTGEAEKAKFQKDLQQVSAVNKQFKVSRFTYDLNPADLSRFDISKFVVGYRTDQMLGDISTCGSIGGSVALQNEIVPFADLDKTPSVASVRRPFYFPDAAGSYVGYSGTDVRLFTENEQIPTVDPICHESVSTLDKDTLVTRIAMMQTLEDGGGSGKKKKGPPFQVDVQRTEIAMRLRGIKNAQKKELIINFLRTGVADPSLLKIPFGAKFSFTTSTKTISLSDSREDYALQLQQLKSLTNANEDGILVSDLVQKMDFLSIFVYKHPISPDLVEEVMTTVDPYIFDKESMFLYTPASFFKGASDISESDTRHFNTYVPEFNGFVAEVDNATQPGVVNNLNVNLLGSMGLMSLSRRIYNSSIYQQAVYDAAEAIGSDMGAQVYQNIFADKTPLTILTTLLDSLYLLRTTQPRKSKEIIVHDDTIAKWKKDITAAAARTPGSFTLDKIDALVARKIRTEESRLKADAVSGDSENNKHFIRDVEGTLTSYLDILSMRAFNQYNEVDKNGVFKGPMQLFNIASYLYASVMRGRRFNVKVPTLTATQEVAKGKKPYDYNPATGEVNGAFDPWRPDELRAVRTKLLKETDGSGGSVLEINPALDFNNPKIPGKDFQSYFLFLNDSLGKFVVDLHTPFEIMNDVVKSCYLELYETPGGRFVFRTPQYNNNEPIYKTYRGGKDILTKTDETTMVTENGEYKAKDVDKEAAGTANMITSEDIIVISSSYHQSLKNLAARQTLGYGVDLIGVPIEQQYYGYTNGKIAAQYGLMVGSPVVNPNVRFKDKIIAETGVDAARYGKGVFEYCRFFLEYSNIRNFSGTITAVGDPKIQVGRTYFDIANQKFGYITRVSKALNVGETYAVSFTVDAVRDAVYGELAPGEIISRPDFRILPALEDMIEQFKPKGGGAVKVRAAKQAAKQEATNIDFILPDRRRPYVDPKPPQQGVGASIPLGRVTGLPPGIKGPIPFPLPFRPLGR